MEASIQLPRWQSHKVVWADKILKVMPGARGRVVWCLECGGNIGVSEDLKVRGGDNPVGGYYVCYEDGYESWSPAKAFEEGYTRIPDGGP